MAIADPLMAMSRSRSRRASPIEAMLDARRIPAFDWAQYFGALGYPDIEAINVLVPGFFHLDPRRRRYPATAWNGIRIAFDTRTCSSSPTSNRW